MRVLFDQGTPVPLRPFLSGHAIRTAAETDKKIRHQQNLAGRRIAIVVLGQARWPLVRVHVARVVAAVNAATPGGYVEVEIPEPR
jgi:hypothetical protein